MPAANAETLLQAVDAANRQDVDAFAECVTPDVQWEENTPVYVGLRACYRGRAGARAWFEEALVEMWDDYRIEVGEIIDLPHDRLVVEMTLRARGKASGVDTRLRIWQTFWFRDGLMARRQLFRERSDALSAADVA